MNEADSIEFPCAQCAKLLRAPARLAGERVRCPNCRQSAEVPLSLETDDSGSAQTLQSEPLSLDDEPEVKVNRPPSPRTKTRGGNDRSRARARYSDEESEAASRVGYGWLYWMSTVFVPVMSLVSLLTAFGVFSTVRAQYSGSGFSERSALRGGSLGAGFSSGTELWNVRIETMLSPLILSSILAVVPCIAWVILRHRHARRTDAELAWWPAMLAMAGVILTPLAAIIVRPTRPPNSFQIHTVLPMDREVWGSVNHYIGLVLLIPVVCTLVWSLYNWRVYVHQNGEPE